MALSDVEISDDESNINDLQEQLEEETIEFADDSDRQETGIEARETEALEAEERTEQTQTIQEHEIDSTLANLKSSAAHQALQTQTSKTHEGNKSPANPKKMVEYELNGIKIQVNTTAAAPIKERAYFSKAKRSGLDETHRMKLLEHVQSKQQVKYHSINVSINDPEKMTNTYTLATLLAENRRNLAKYDLLDVYSIVKPKPHAFTDGHTDFAALELGPDQKPITHDLFIDYLKLTPERVAASSKWYALFVPETNLMQEDLSWSQSYYEKNVESELYLKVYNKLMRHEAAARGGPLFLKILLDCVTTTGEQNLKSLIQIVETYRIKTSSPGEDVDRVVNMFDAIFDNIDTLRNGVLPPNLVENLLIVFQSTSVPKFNSYFERFQNQLIDAEIQTAIDPSYQFHGQGSVRLGNNMKSVKHILSYAETHYRNLLRKGEWDECLQKKPGKSTFFTADGKQIPQPREFKQPNGSERKETMDECFNCGSTTHRLSQCPLPRDNDRIERNRAKHPAYIKMKERLHKWRPPDEAEHNKRVINGKPHTFNPNLGRRGRWVEDMTPNDGQPNDGAPPTSASSSSGTEPHQVFLSDVRSILSGLTLNQTKGDPSVSDGTTDDNTAGTKLALAIEIANLQKQLESLE